MTAIFRDETTQRAIEENAENAEKRLISIFVSAGASKDQAQHMTRLYGSAISSNNAIPNEGRSNTRKAAEGR